MGRSFNALLAALVWLLVGLGGEYRAGVDQVRAEAVLHDRALRFLEDKRAALDGVLNATMFLNSGLVAYVQAHPKLNAHTARSMLRTLYIQGHILRNIGLAPDNHLTYVYPETGNERAIGLYYPDVPDQWPAVQRAIRDHAPRLAGPVRLKQGGIGFIYRVPVFLDPSGHYWGLLSTVINADGLYASAGIRPTTDGMQVALRGRDGSGTDGPGFFGDPELFETDALRAPIHTPGGSWEIAVRPIDGWRARGATVWVRPAAWILGGALALTVYQFLRMRAARAFAQEALARGNARLKALFDRSPFGIVLTDVQGRFTEWNGALCNMLGGSPDGRAMRDMESRFSRHLLPCKVAAGNGTAMASPRHQPWNVEYARPDGAAITLRIHGIEIPQDGPEHPQWYIVEDITEAKVAEQEIRRLAFYDPLTLLPNRRLLLDRLHHALDSSARRASFGALLFVDLDDFKILNDTLGHNAGDQLLVQVAQRITSCLRTGDTAARLGGDEFVIMIEDLATDAAEAASLATSAAEEILAALNIPYRIAGQDRHSGASIGVKLFQANHEPVEELLRHADLAMYQAKSSGRNAIRFFDPQMQSIVSRNAAMLEELRDAIQARSFALYLQPQVDAAMHCTGAEVLLRWIHPTQGIRLPGEFIRIAEDSGLILPLGRWVLAQGCLLLANWRTMPEFSALTLSVNISARQLQHPDFVGQVRDALDASGADPSRLRLELTESSMMDAMEDAIAKMVALRRLGVRFSLDDFGTGHSSLAYLKRLPLDALKIDRSFIDGLPHDTNDTAIVRTIIALARSLELDLVAEGVESDEQLDFLSSLGCHTYQGYLIDRPVPIPEFNRKAAGACYPRMHSDGGMA